MNNLIKVEIEPGYIIMVTPEEAEKYNFTIVKKVEKTNVYDVQTPEKNKSVKPQSKKGE